MRHGWKWQAIPSVSTRCVSRGETQTSISSGLSFTTATLTMNNNEYEWRLGLGGSLGERAALENCLQVWENPSGVRLLSDTCKVFPGVPNPPGPCSPHPQMPSGHSLTTSHLQYLSLAEARPFVQQLCSEHSLSTLSGLGSATRALLGAMPQEALLPSLSIPPIPAPSTVLCSGAQEHPSSLWGCLCRASQYLRS